MEVEDVGRRSRASEQVKGPDGTQHWIGDFAIVGDGHRSWLGIIAGQNDAGQMMLSPAYAYVEDWPILPNGQIGRLRVVTPLESLVSLTTIEVHPVSVLLLSQCDEGDLETFAKLVKGAEEGRARARAARSGLTLDTAMPANGAAARTRTL